MPLRERIFFIIFVFERCFSTASTAVVNYMVADTKTPPSKAICNAGVDKLGSIMGGTPLCDFIDVSQSH